MALPRRSEVATPEATYGSFGQSDSNAAAPPASGAVRPASSTGTQDRDGHLSHVGTWVTDEQRRGSASLTEGHQSLGPCLSRERADDV
jgi:hypothetical protein